MPNQQRQLVRFCLCHCATVSERERERELGKAREACKTHSQNNHNTDLNFLPQSQSHFHLGNTFPQFFFLLHAVCFSQCCVILISAAIMTNFGLGGTWKINKSREKERTTICRFLYPFATLSAAAVDDLLLMMRTNRARKKSSTTIGTEMK